MRGGEMIIVLMIISSFRNEPCIICLLVPPLWLKNRGVAIILAACVADQVCLCAMQRNLQDFEPYVSQDVTIRSDNIK
jgi:hypothetical protein